MSDNIRCPRCGRSVLRKGWKRHRLSYLCSGERGLLPRPPSRVFRPIRWYQDRPADGHEVTVAGTRWVWLDGHGWLTPNEARAAA